MSSAPRVCCLQCGSQIGRMRGPRAKFCSGMCRDKHKKAIQQGGKELSLTKLSIKAKKKGSVLFHDCIFGGGEGIDPFVPERCKCKKTVSEERAQSLIARGEALDFETRTPVFAGGAIVQIGKLLRTPRSATCERPHAERLVETGSAIKAKSKYSEKQLREMHDAVELDKRENAYEQAYRLEHYNELTMEARRAWIVEVPADEYDKAEREARGRALFTNFSDERTPGGIGVDVDPLLWNGEFDDLEPKTELCDDETETEKEGIEESDERSAEEVLAEYEEIET